MAMADPPNMAESDPGSSPSLPAAPSRKPVACFDFAVRCSGGDRRRDPLGAVSHCLSSLMRSPLLLTLLATATTAVIQEAAEEEDAFPSEHTDIVFINKGTVALRLLFKKNPIF